MPFKKGDKKPPTSGRKRKTQNKTNAESKQISLGMQMVLANEIEDYIISGQFKDDLSKVKDPKDRLLVIAKYANYVMAKRQAVDGSIDINTAPATIDDTLASLSEENEI